MKKLALICAVFCLITFLGACDNIDVDKAETSISETTTEETTTAETTTEETTTAEATTEETTTAETTTEETTTAETTTVETTTAETTTAETTTEETTTAETTTAETTTAETTTAETTTAETTTAVTTTAVTTTAVTTTAETTTVEVAETELSDYQQEVLDLVNECRIAGGVAPLDSDYEALNKTAQIRAVELEEYYSHTRPDGSSCFSAFDECGITELTRAENIAWGDGGNKTPEEVVGNWINSPGHYKNIMNPDYKHLGVGFHTYESVLGNDACYCWVQNFCS